MGRFSRPILLFIFLIVFFFQGAVIAESSSVSSKTTVFEHHHHTEEQAIRKIFGDVHWLEESFIVGVESRQRIETKLDWHLDVPSLNVRQIYDKSNTLLGYTVVLDELGKHQPITFLVAVSPDFSLKDFLLLIYREHRGDEVKKRRFRKQFWGKTAAAPLQVDYDIDGITGATISSWSIASGVKKALLLVEEFQNAKNKTKEEKSTP